ncbi:MULTISPECIES: DUF805 domain-containing protein [unclassified Bradyrhizobium]|uniref:DUF805 domain-containing protein n=1 Tax=unclassified Bradyrhizobium TaxID=2631580 RepID=UPI00040CB6EA|nr:MULTISPECIES: DUF805 domain-containing protein [unclassified Bradyrhizobium]QIG96758.1 DUF805 domain-containing protein [Bradyrhizobium sp. 6(2017)]
MDWANYLFGFKGRVNRAKFWLGGLIIVCWMMFLALLVVSAGLGGKDGFGFNVDDIFRAFDPDSYKSLTSAGLPALLVKASGTALFVWVYIAVSIKRLHDRDKSGWWMVPFFAIPGLMSQFSDRLPDESYWVMAAGTIVFVLYIWGFIELAFLRGTSYPNRYGPNPLGKAHERRGGDSGSGSRSGRGWDQQSELDIVPHKAGPPAV